MECFEELTKDCLNDDLGLTLSFLWQGQICFMGFNIGRVHGLCRIFGAKVNKDSKIGEHDNIFCIRGQENPFTLNQCLSYFDSFKLSGMFR